MRSNYNSKGILTFLLPVNFVDKYEHEDKLDK